MRRHLQLLALAVGIVLMAGTSPAQDQVQIIRAEFGLGNQWADVTAQVQSLVSGQGLNFRVDVDHLQVDPVPNQRKILRLKVRNSRGEIQDLTYPEKSIVRLYVASGYGQAPQAPYGAPPYGGPPRGEEHGGDYGRGLQITRAEYGAGPRVRDVTDRLSRMIQGDQLNVRVSSSVMGGDPAEGQPKTLTVWYTYNGRPGQVVVPERDTLILPGGGESNYYRSRLRIARAQYGGQSRFVDVTEQLNSQIQNDSLNLQVTNYAMGGDPAPGEHKVLTVFYIFNGRNGRAFANEGEFLTLPRGNGDRDRDDDAYYHKYWPGGSDNSLQILQATWGERDHQADVTGRIASMVQGNRLELPVTNQFMGGDPAYGSTKFLRVIYLWRGLRYEANATEGQTLSIP
jgi:hypothetical protein